MKRSFLKDLFKRFELFVNQVESPSAVVRQDRTMADRSGGAGRLGCLV
jgi:hypothetical protein